MTPILITGFACALASPNWRYGRRRGSTQDGASLDNHCASFLPWFCGTIGVTAAWREA